MAISAAQVKELRERTGAGMMECKKALEAANGDIDAAAEAMRREGLAKADKKAGRIAAEGRVAVAVNGDGTEVVLAEINCETDFVGKNEDFVAFADAVAATALAGGIDDLETLAEAGLDGATVEDRRRALIAALGEKISVRRLQRIRGESGVIATYLHGSRIGSAVALSGGDETLARDLAMHVAASAPRYLDADAVPGDVREKEREVLSAQARESGKPEDIIAKMVEGRLRKFLGEMTLLGQPFVKDPDQTVAKLLQAAGAEVIDFARFEVGEGIDKKEEDFAAEVKAQAEKSTEEST